ncbi:MAG TPA: ABC transporter ATP-binding protein [Devosiaceae bacterium]|jgi:oligopeptide/dipeptide ABC transporter ATP-binding protein
MSRDATQTAPGALPRGNILEVDRLSIAYRTGKSLVHVVREVSLAVGQRESVGIVGESGSGKSTLARALLGLLPERTSLIQGGHLTIAGRDVTHYGPSQWESVRGNPVAMVFQDPLSYLNPVARVAAQIGESVRRHDPRVDRAQRVAELLALVKLPAAAARAYPHELSGGMRQRALLAVALGCRPKLLVADEPTTALDITTQAEILDLLKSLRDELDMGLLVISHDLSVISAACERLYVMYAGRMVEWGNTPAIFGQPAHPYTSGLLQAAMAEKDERGRFITIPGNVFDLRSTAAGCPFQPRCPHAIAACAEAMPAPTPFGAGGNHQVRCLVPNAVPPAKVSNHG